MREARAIRDRSANWKLAFGAGAFLLVWVLGLSRGLPLDIVLVRAAVGAALGAIVGAVVGMTLKGLTDLAAEPEKGVHLDVTVPAGEDELAAGLPEDPEDREAMAT